MFSLGLVDFFFIVISLLGLDLACGLLVDRFEHCMFEVLFRAVWVLFIGLLVLMVLV